MCEQSDFEKKTRRNIPMLAFFKLKEERVPCGRESLVVQIALDLVDAAAETSPEQLTGVHQQKIAPVKVSRRSDSSTTDGLRGDEKVGGVLV